MPRGDLRSRSQARALPAPLTGTCVALSPRRSLRESRPCGGPLVATRRRTHEGTSELDSRGLPGPRLGGGPGPGRCAGCLADHQGQDRAAHHRRRERDRGQRRQRRRQGHPARQGQVRRREGEGRHRRGEGRRREERGEPAPGRAGCGEAHAQGGGRLDQEQHRNLVQGGAGPERSQGRLGQQRRRPAQREDPQPRRQAAGHRGGLGGARRSSGSRARSRPPTSSGLRPRARRDT